MGLVLVPPTKFADAGHFVHTSRRLADETPGAVWANQFDNVANRKAHIESTAPEIWEQLEGRIDGFTCAAGTGGTIAGVGLGLKAFDLLFGGTLALYALGILLWPWAFRGLERVD